MQRNRWQSEVERPVNRALIKLLTREAGESWRDCLARSIDECPTPGRPNKEFMLVYFDRILRQGLSEFEAAEAVVSDYNFSLLTGV